MLNFDDLFNDLLLDTNIFAKKGIYTSSGGSTNEVNCIFDNAFVPVEFLGEGGVSSLCPQVLCKSSDLSSVSTGETIEIDDVTYYIVEVRPDGVGMTALILSRDQ